MPHAEGSQALNPESTTARRSRLLHLINEAARGLALAGVLATAMPSEARGQESREPQKLEQQAEEQSKKLDAVSKKEDWLKKTFGAFFYERAPQLRQKLQGALEDARSSGKTVLENVAESGEGTQETPETPKILLTDLEGKEGVLPSHVLRQVLEETYPKGWVNNEVAIVEQKSVISDQEEAQEEEAARKDYEFKGEVPVTRAKFYMEGGVARVVLYPTVKKTGVKEIIEGDVAHEVLGHGNDWDSDNEMSANDRADLLHAVYQRLDAPDRYRSSYVEGIDRDISDPQKRDYFKAKEYWAEIVSQFFKDADQLSDTDYEIINWRVASTDPQFNWKAASQRREQLVRQALTSQKNAARSPRR
ncbi:MAG: hypothetical protein Q8N81_02360 [bacterium]|nr:hypothetical protein [bacterium]